MEDQGFKRASARDGGPPEKRLKGEPEDTEVYSQRIKKKLQANSRTGQACDRCKERKMKCDSGQDGCQPCQSKNFRCVATDRITGHAHERGETARLKKEVEELRAQLNAYCQQAGPLPPDYSLPNAYQQYAPHNGYNSNPSPTQPKPLTQQDKNMDAVPANNADAPHRGPIHETNIDFVDGAIDVGAFDCPDMADTIGISQATLPLNNSRRSSLNTILGAQKPKKPQMPSRDESLQFVDNYLKVIAPYVPILHGPTFRNQVADFYDNSQSFDEKPAETVMIMVVLAIFTYQLAIRNPSMRQEKLAESNRLYHYSLTFYPELLLGDSLADMQALALFLVHARNLPKPGNSWTLSSMILARAVELKYHRSSSKISLPLDQRNALAIELRKRVFWSILGVQVTIAVKLGRPMAISTHDMDVELPHPVLDSEITEQGVVSRSGDCDFWGHIFLSKKLPLLIDLYENVILVRKPGAEYCRDVKELDAKITNWRHDWDRDTANQTKNGSHQISTNLIEIWYAEFRAILHHPRLCTSQAVETHEKNLDICLEASRTTLRNVVSLITHFRGADFTWHFVSGYVLAMGMAMHVYNKRRAHLTTETFNKMKIELTTWLFVMRNADHFMDSGDHLTNFFQPRVQRFLEDAQNVVTASEALRNGYRHSAQSQPKQPESPAQPPYSTADSYQHITPYTDNLPTNVISTINPPASQQQQQQHEQQAYNTQPPAPPTSSAHSQQHLGYDSTNYPISDPQPPLSSSSIAPPTTAATPAPPNHTVSFIPEPATYPRTPTYPTTTPAAPIYPPAAGATAMSYPTTAPETFPSKLYSNSQVTWPASIVQYQNGGM